MDPDTLSHSSATVDPIFRLTGTLVGVRVGVLRGVGVSVGVLVAVIVGVGTGFTSSLQFLYCPPSTSFLAHPHWVTFPIISSSKSLTKFPAHGSINSSGLFRVGFVTTKANRLQWSYFDNTGKVIQTFIFGQSGDGYVAGCNFDGDKISDPSVFNASTFSWKSGRKGKVNTVRIKSFGRISNISCGDVTGDGKDEVILVAKKKGGGSRIQVLSVKSKKGVASYEIANPLSQIFVLDSNGDGLGEVAVVQGSGKNRKYRNLATTQTLELDSTKPIVPLTLQDSFGDAVDVLISIQEGSIEALNLLTEERHGYVPDSNIKGILHQVVNSKAAKAGF